MRYTAESVLDSDVIHALSALNESYVKCAILKCA